jgi:hypothetical protein
MTWVGSKETVAARVERPSQLHEAAPSSIGRELALPMRSRPHGPTRELMAETCKLMTNFVGLQEKSARLVGRVVLCRAAVEAVSVAPTLVTDGSDTARRNHLVALFHCLCRHSLRLTGVVPARGLTRWGNARL